MPLVLLSAIAIVSLVLLGSLSILLMWKQIQKQSEQIQTLTNLAASKDLTAFTALQERNSVPQMEMMTPTNPMDDQSMARLLARKYDEMGLDPNAAYNNEDDPINDFGGPEAFR